MNWLKRIAAALFGRDEIGSASRGLRTKRGGKEKLAQRQKDLGDRLEGLFKAYEDRLGELSLCIRNLDEECGEAEMARIDNLQKNIRTAFLRLDAAQRSTADLRRDYAYWRDRDQEEEARCRLEIIASELATRGEIVERRSEEEQDEQRIVEIREEEVEEPMPQERATEPTTISWIKVESVEDPDQECLVRAIREAAREANRWHALPDESQDEEALIQVKHLRDLHAQLKLRDRQSGTIRYRLPLSVEMR